MAIYDNLLEVSTAQSAVGSTGDFASTNHVPLTEIYPALNPHYLRQLGSGEPIWLEVEVTETFVSSDSDPVTGGDYFRFGVAMSSNAPLAALWTVSLGQSGDIRTQRLVQGAKFWVGVAPIPQDDLILAVLGSTGLDITPQVDADTNLPTPVAGIAPHGTHPGGGVIYGVYHREGTYSAGAFSARFVDRIVSPHTYPRHVQHL